MPSRASGYGGYGQRPAYGAGRQSYGGGRTPVGRDNPGPPLSTYGSGTPGRRPLQTAPRSVPAPSLQLSKGDTVDHKAFGKGTVLSVQAMGGDALVEIAFENAGTKRLMLKSAAAYMTKC